MRVTADVSMENCDGNGSMRMMIMEIHVCESNRKMRRAMSMPIQLAQAIALALGLGGILKMM